MAQLPVLALSEYLTATHFLVKHLLPKNVKLSPIKYLIAFRLNTVYPT